MQFEVWIGFQRVQTEVIEWADVEKRWPIAFFITCPGCHCKQWAKVDYLYRGFDGSDNNFRCRKCGLGKVKPGDRLRRKLETYKSFSPKGTGWRSIINNNATMPQPHK